MRKIIFTIILFCPFLSLTAQKKNRIPSDTWWTVNGGMQILTNDVYITAKQPSIGYGSGHTILFKKQNKNTSHVWKGVEFMHHYFGVKKINEYRVFYESWQLAYLVRLSNPGHKKIKLFIDFSAGGRYLVSFTTENRTYTGILLRRFVELINREDIQVENNYRIVKEYGKLNLMGSISGGIVFKKRNSEFTGLSIKGSLNLGTTSRFADYRKIIDDIDTYQYPLRNGSGMYFTIQAGYSFKF